MSSPTNWQADLLRSRAIAELAEGNVNGPGLAFVRSFLAAVDAGRIVDPGLPRSPQPTPLKRASRPITNDILDGRERQIQREPGPVRGTLEWFAARRATKAAK